jgi:hypothetical protein
MSAETEVPQAVVKQKNSKAVAGFVLSIVNVLLYWVPFLGFILAVLGLIFSSFGMHYSKNRGLAVAGFILAIVFVILHYFLAIGGIFFGIFE